MNYQPIYLDATESQQLLVPGNEAPTLLYIYLRNGNELRSAKAALGFSDTALSEAVFKLQQLRLYHGQPLPSSAKRITYGERDVAQEANSNNEFRTLTDEVQYRLGRMLNTEELKLLLNMYRYLGLSMEIICLLVSHMVSCEKQRGNLKPPSMYKIEKEAYRWSEAGIDTVEEAFTYIHQKKTQQDAMGRLMQILQIRGRSLTAPEEKYATAWLQMGMAEELLQMAYEQTCLKTGGMNWAYMNAILLRWKDAGYRTVADVKNKWRKGAMPSGPRQLDEAEREAIQRMMSMDMDDFLDDRTAHHILTK